MSEAEIDVDEPGTVDYRQIPKDEPDGPPKLCGECGGPEGGPHFDDCEIGLGADALPKTVQAREALTRARKRGSA